MNQRTLAATAIAAVCMMACVFMPGALRASQGQSPLEKAIPMNRLGAEIDQRYSTQGSGPVATDRGYRLAAKMQALEAEVTPAGLTVTSLAKTEGQGSFSIVPVALNGKTLASAAQRTVRTDADGSVVLERGLLRERFTASSDGIRQDFIISAAHASAPSELALSLTVNGSTVSASENSSSSMVLTLDSGRKLAYSRLQATDAGGRELAARMEPPASCGKEFRIVVDARDARYPVTIDPTITDDDWESMNPGIPGVHLSVDALAVDSSGTLYAAGGFTIAGNVSARGIAKWNGESWSALGSGVGGVETLAVDASGNLYAGGDFTTAGGVSANRVAKWDGTTWSALGAGMDDDVRALAIDASSGTLYAGGSFTTAGGLSIKYIAKWDGTSWSALGSGVNNWVFTLTTDASSGTLYAGGWFTTAGDVSANRVAKWDGTTWSALGAGAGPFESPDDIYALAVDASGTLYVGGLFTFLGSEGFIYDIAKWDGTAWSALGSGTNSEVHALAVDASGNLYAGGWFTTAGGVSANHVAKWDGRNWSALGSGIAPGQHDRVHALAVDASGTLYAGGFFKTAGDENANNIAKWDGTAWSALGPAGMENGVFAFVVDPSSGCLYAGGWFTTVGGVNTNHIVKWDGETWSTLGSGIGDSGYTELKALAVDSSGTLYAGGFFVTAGGVSANNIAKWDGMAWSALGSGVTGDIYALAVDSSGTLYAGGFFTTAGGVSANNIAKWDGEAWAALGAGMDDSVSALCCAQQKTDDSCVGSCGLFASGLLFKSNRCEIA